MSAEKNEEEDGARVQHETGEYFVTAEAAAEISKVAQSVECSLRERALSRARRRRVGSETGLVGLSDIIDVKRAVARDVLDENARVYRTIKQWSYVLCGLTGGVFFSALPIVGNTANSPLAWGAGSCFGVLLAVGLVLEYKAY